MHGHGAGTVRSAGQAAPRKGDVALPPGPRRASAAAPSASADASSAVKPSPALGAPASAASGAPSAHAAAAAASARPMLSAEGGAPAPAACQGQAVSMHLRRCPCLSWAGSGRRIKLAPLALIEAGEACVVEGLGHSMLRMLAWVKRSQTYDAQQIFACVPGHGSRKAAQSGPASVALLPAAMNRYARARMPGCRHMHSDMRLGRAARRARTGRR